MQRKKLWKKLQIAAGGDSTYYLRITRFMVEMMNSSRYSSPVHCVGYFCACESGSARQRCS